ncbi:MAG: glycoside hydrolase family 3 protein [Clostridia bacterium]|nr:glycoside hydrolase family 3 protein [Clostridia bacterium]
MNVIRDTYKVKEEKWARYQYNLTTNIGEGGKRLTGCDEHIKISRNACEEGIVLLENNGLLPLKENTTVAIFGVGSIEYIQCGGGSGRVYSAYIRNFYEGFKAKSPRINVYEPVSKFYYDFVAEKLDEQERNGIFEWLRIVPETEVPLPLVEDAAKNADVAVIVIHRFSCEACDRSAAKGDFYLTDEEQQMVDAVTASFDHSVVVLNVGGIIDVSWVKKNPKIDALLLGWQGGMEGAMATADIICGDVNPSGKLTDTFAESFDAYPFADSYSESNDYVNYFEDIFVGYRYFETISGASEKVVYPFGFGLSYTEFLIAKPVASLKGDKIEIKTSVKNIGSVAGKEVVQVYFSAPQGKLGKSKISLAGFKKTKLLAPAEQEDITIEFDVASMASYDDLGKLQMSAYVLERGEYVFLVGNSCRNLQAADWKYEIKEEFVVTKQLTQKCAPNKLEKRMLADGSFEELPSFPVANYDEVSAPVNTETAPESKTPFKLLDVYEGKITLNQFVSQLTDEELIKLMSGIPCHGTSDTCGIGGISRLGIPPIMTADGPAGVRLFPQTGISTTSWPCATLIACTWNPDIAYAIGAAGAMEAKENGIGIWLTPALNIHRNPLCGRNFEYFSEDPLVSGKFASAKVQGIQSQKVGATAKHFCCNNKEGNRRFSDSRVSERALREIYLRGFEICVKESQPWLIMNSYNILNDRRCCTGYEQIQGILRDEWGFEGLVISDWGTPCDQTYCVLSGNDVRMPSGDEAVLKESLEKGRIKREHLELCAKRICEMILKLD